MIMQKRPPDPHIRQPGLPLHAGGIVVVAAQRTQVPTAPEQHPRQRRGGGCRRADRVEDVLQVWGQLGDALDEVVVAVVEDVGGAQRLEDVRVPCAAGGYHADAEEGG